MNQRKIYDVTIPIREDMVMYANELKPTIKTLCSMDKGKDYNLTLLTLSSHTGTHIDAPRHFVRDGITMGEIPMDRFVGKVKVFELRDRKRITASDLEGLPIGEGDRVFFKTDNVHLVEDEAFTRDYCSLDGSAAQYLVDRGVIVVGIDYLSVEDADFSADVHVKLLGAGIVLYEGLDLREVSEGVYDLVGLPLKTDGCEGAPARVILMK